MLVSRETKNRQNVVALPLTEVSVLEELDALLLENGSLKEGEAIPVVSKDRLASNESTIGYYAENNAVVALSVRYCALTSLPASLGNLTHLTHLDLRANKLVSLPASIGDLTNLVKLDVRWNKLSSFPEWLQRLEERGCTVFT